MYLILQPHSSASVSKLGELDQAVLPHIHEGNYAFNFLSSQFIPSQQEGVRCWLAAEACISYLSLWDLGEVHILSLTILPNHFKIHRASG